MRGILADTNIGGHFQILLRLFQEKSRKELWESLKLSTPTFHDLGLPDRALDSVVWNRCQQDDLVLITANRNASGPDSLESAIRTSNSPGSLPVFTIADPDSVMESREYAERVADRLLEYLFDIERCRGVERLYLP